MEVDDGSGDSEGVIAGQDTDLVSAVHVRLALLGQAYDPKIDPPKKHASHSQLLIAAPHLVALIVR